MKTISVLGILLVLSFAQASHAAVTTFLWSGNITEVLADDGTGIYTGIQVGDTVSGTFTYDPDVNNITGLDTSDGDSSIEATDTWVEYFLGSGSGELQIRGGNGTTTIVGLSSVDHSITNNHPVENQASADYLSALLGTPVSPGDPVDNWGLGASNFSLEANIEYVSLLANMYDDLSFRTEPPWSPANTPSDPSKQIVMFEIVEFGFDAPALEVRGVVTIVGAPGCGAILTENTTLESDMVCPDTALSFANISDDVVLDCDGHSISTTSNRVISGGTVSGITIKNCNLSTTHDSGRGIVLSGLNNSTISNNTITTTGDSSRAIQLRRDSNSNVISDNMVHTSGLFSNGIRIEAGSSFNTVTNNTFQADASYAVSIRSGSGNALTGNTLISPSGYLYQGRFGIQNGGLSVDSAGNIYAVENNWGSSNGIGEATAFFQVNPVTGGAFSVIPLLDDGGNVGIGFDSLEILPDGRFIATQGPGSGVAPLVEINPISGEVTGLPLNTSELSGKLNGLVAIDNNTLLATTNQGNLASINLTTGLATLIGDQGIGWTDLTIHPTSGKAYTVSRRSDEDSNTAHLYEINANTGQVITEIGDTGITSISDIDFALDGTLYGNFDLLVINTTTGVGTFVGDGFGDDPLEPISQHNTIENNVMLTDEGSIQSTDSIILPTGEANISSTRVKIIANEAMVDSSALPFLDEPARITLKNLAGTERSLLIDPEDDGSFVACDSPQCTLVSFTDGTLIFDVDGFTTYSSVEGAGANSSIDIVVDFGGIGLWARINDTNWVQLSNSSPTEVVTGDMDGSGADDVIAAFDFGTYVKYDLGPWQRLHRNNSEALSVGDLDNNGQDDVVIDFGVGNPPGNPNGLWARMNDTSWIQFSNLSPSAIVTGDMDGSGADDVIAAFAFGIYVRYDLGPWQRLHNTSPEAMSVGDLDDSGQDDVVIDFGAGVGLYARMNDTSWLKLYNGSPDLIATGDIDGNGADDVVATFASSVGGSWVKLNLGGWSKLSSLAADDIVTGDVDASGQDDVIASFGSTIGGIYVKRNQGPWGLLNNSPSDDLATGQLDGD